MNDSAIVLLLVAGLAACGSGDNEGTAAPAAVVVAAPAAAADEVSPTKTIAAFRSNARDPGPRGGVAGAGDPLTGVATDAMLNYAFGISKIDFSETEELDEGLGPTMNLDSCSGCHSQPAVGGSSPPINPQVAFAAASTANKLPPFLSRNGPVREARFVRNADGSPDGGVHAIFTIAGRAGAPDGCAIKQPDFAAALANRNVIFRIPTPVFGAGLIEMIPDRTIAANMVSNTSAKQTLGIRGRGNVVLPFATISAQPNKNGNDGTFARFGWKAQNKSLLVFAGEAYNVEMGITNELFQTERDETDACQGDNVQPNSVTNLAGATPADGISSIEKFALFMRLLAPPMPSTTEPGGATSIASGKALFSSVGCALCHTPTFKTGNAGLEPLRNKDVNLFSDLLVHDMGVGLADGVSQGQAGPREFRSAPLWGLGKRLFFLHDGRTSDLREAVYAHRSDGSEANGVIDRLGRLGDREEQDLLNFLRSL